MTEVAGFTSTRTLTHDAEVLLVRELQTIPPADAYVTGACRGGDAFIGEWMFWSHPDAEHIVIVPANKKQIERWWEKPAVRDAVTMGRKLTIEYMPASTDYRARNTALVKRATRFYGYPAYSEDDRRSQRSGTWMTIRIADRANKLVRTLTLLERTI